MAHLFRTIGIPLLLLAMIVIVYFAGPQEEDNPARMVIIGVLTAALTAWGIWFVFKLLLGRREEQKEWDPPLDDWLSEQVYNQTQDPVKVIIEPWDDVFELPPDSSLFVKVPDGPGVDITQSRDGDVVRVRCENVQHFRVTQEGRTVRER